MKLTIECECGNMITIPAQPKKYVQLKDYLKSKQFHYDGAKFNDEGKIKELQISCNKCQNWIVFSVD